METKLVDAYQDLVHLCLCLCFCLSFLINHRHLVAILGKTPGCPGRWIKVNPKRGQANQVNRFSQETASTYNFQQKADAHISPVYLRNISFVEPELNLKICECKKLHVDSTDRMPYFASAYFQLILRLQLLDLDLLRLLSEFNQWLSALTTLLHDVRLRIVIATET